MQNISKAMGAHFYSGDVKDQNTQKTPFLCHIFGQAMSKWLLGDVKLSITRSPDPPESLVFLHVWFQLSFFEISTSFLRLKHTIGRKVFETVYAAKLSQNVM